MAIGAVQDEAFTDDDVLAVLSERPPQFDYNQFMASLGMEQLASPSLDASDIPPEQWQTALKYRTLTPAEQAARERYFEDKAAQALRGFTR